MNAVGAKDLDAAVDEVVGSGEIGLHLGLDSEIPKSILGDEQKKYSNEKLRRQEAAVCQSSFISFF